MHFNIDQLILAIPLLMLLNFLVNVCGLYMNWSFSPAVLLCKTICNICSIPTNLFQLIIIISLFGTDTQEGTKEFTLTSLVASTCIVMYSCRLPSFTKRSLVYQNLQSTNKSGPLHRLFLPRNVH